MPTLNEMIDFCEDFASYDCFSNEQFARREMFYAISDELQKSLREQKRPHGEWIFAGVCHDENNPIDSDTYYCSICKRSISTSLTRPEILFPFCHCGADMRKKEGKNE